MLLALFMLLGSALTALWLRLSFVGIVTALAVAGLVIANIPSLFNGDTIANLFTQPATLPSYQLAAINHLNATHPGTRVFAIPGNDFATYRWGDTIDTPQPALLNRDFITREQQIMGSIATADTLYAVDGPIQDGIANMNALAPMSRLMGAGDVMVEYDQRYEQYGVPQPQLLALAAPPDAGRPQRPHLVRGAPAERVDRVDAERAGPLGARQRRVALPHRHLHGGEPAALAARRVQRRRHRHGGRRHRGEQPGRARAAQHDRARSTTPARWPPPPASCSSWRRRARSSW